MTTLLAIFMSYAIGSIPTGYLIGKWVGKIDIREHGSGNVGATNVFRTIGKTWGITALIIDILKGFVVAFWIARLTYSGALPVSATLYQLSLGLIAIGGHTWPIWLKFKGGKGVATSCGVFLGIFPKAVLAAIVVWILCALISRYVSLSSMLATLSFLGWMIVFYSNSESFPFGLAVSILIFAFFIYTHRSNIKRLLAGTENKIGSRKKTS